MATDSTSHRPLLSAENGDVYTDVPVNKTIPGTRFRFCSYLFLCIIVINLCLMIYWRYDFKETLRTISYHIAPRTDDTNDTTAHYNTDNKVPTRRKWLSKSKLEGKSGESISGRIVGNLKSLVGMADPDDVYKQYLCLDPDDQTDPKDLYKWFKPDSITLPPIPERGFKEGAPAGFKISTSYSERKKMIDLIAIFRDTIHANNFTFLLYGGTSLGAYRHHGFVAWDDDMDVWIPMVHRDEIARKLRAVGREYGVWTTGGTFQWKFYYANAPKIRTAWRWPYLDIFFYEKNDTHVWDVSKCCGYYHIGDVFPPRQIPFGGLTFPGPRNLPKFLFDYYGNINEQCKTTDFNHRHEYSKSERSQTIPCKGLYSYYPFVFRTQRNGFVEESLRVGNEELYSIHVPKYCSGPVTVDKG